MKMKKILLLATIFLGIQASAQDLHLTQFYMSPMTLNPALTGVFNGNYRFTGNYRNQWSSVIANPYETVAGGIEFSGKSGDFNRVGVGLHVLSDQAGTSQLTTNIFSGQVSYNFALSRNMDYYISTGLNVAYTQKSINPLYLTFGNQYGDAGYDPNNPTGESFSTNNYSYADASLGFLWYHIQGKRHNQFLGVSLWHVNRPNLAFIDNDLDKLYMKIVGHAGMEFPISGKADMTPYLLAMKQGPHTEIEVGSLFKFILEERKGQILGGTNFYVGPFYRIVGNQTTAVFSDALILATKLDVGGFTFGLSYDINVSGLVPASASRGGPELAVQYTGAFKHQSSKTFCPRF